MPGLQRTGTPPRRCRLPQRAREQRVPWSSTERPTPHLLSLPFLSPPGGSWNPRCSYLPPSRAAISVPLFSSITENAAAFASYRRRHRPPLAVPRAPTSASRPPLPPAASNRHQAAQFEHKSSNPSLRPPQFVDESDRRGQPPATSTTPPCSGSSPPAPLRRPPAGGVAPIGSALPRRTRSLLLATWNPSRHPRASTPPRGDRLCLERERHRPRVEHLLRVHAWSASVAATSSPGPHPSASPASSAPGEKSFPQIQIYTFYALVPASFQHQPVVPGCARLHDNPLNLYKINPGSFPV